MICEGGEGFWGRSTNNSASLFPVRWGGKTRAKTHLCVFFRGLQGGGEIPISAKSPTAVQNEFLVLASFGAHIATSIERWGFLSGEFSVSLGQFVALLEVHIDAGIL